jgi:molybdopterin-guanine dinucleotide biosynthesis protein
MDIERIKLMEAKKYHVLVEGFVKEMLPKILAVEEYTKMKKESYL